GNVLGETAGQVRTDEPSIRADVGMSGATPSAGSASYQRLHHHPLPVSDAGNALSDRVHSPGKLMAHDRGRHPDSTLPEKAVQVRAADAARLDPDHHFARSWLRPSHLLQSDLAGS